MKKLLVIGSSGLVGSRFVELSESIFDITSVAQGELDITDKNSINAYFTDKKFDAVVNLAAYTDVAGAESQTGDEEGMAWKLNALAPKYLAEELNGGGTYLIHFSTDFVFEGLEDSKGPFDEDAPIPSTNANLCWYGWTKLKGEKFVRETSNSAAIVRIAYPFRSKFDGKADWARKIIELYDSKSLYPLFDDQTITPIFIDEIVPALQKIIEEGEAGTYHIASRDLGTYFEMGSYILEKTRGVKDAVQKASLVEFLKTPGRNKRPIWGGLKTEKTQEKLGLKFKTWKEMIDAFASQLNPRP